MTTQNLRRLDHILNLYYTPANAVEFELVMRDFLWANPGLEYEYPFLPDGYDPVLPQTLGGRGLIFGTDNVPPVGTGMTSGGSLTLGEVETLLAAHTADGTAHHTPPSTATFASQSDLTNEANTRAAADSGLDTRLTAVEGKTANAGLDQEQVDARIATNTKEFAQTGGPQVGTDDVAVNLSLIHI